MLQELSIQNLALIEKLQLNFNRGFSSLTGETGAGKSILLDALGLTLGDRSDSSLVRHNTPRAEVTALFDIKALPHVQAWLIEQELDDELDCYLRRTVTIEGRSKAYINGRPIPASQLKTLGSMLIDIHGQHEHQSLLSNQKQLGLLDAYAVHPDLIKTCHQDYQAWQVLNRQLTAQLANQADFQSKFELLSFQNSEFDEVQPIQGEFEELSEEQSQLSHANEIILGCENAYAAIEGDSGAADLMNQAIHAIESIVTYSPSLHSAIKQFNSALIEAQEAAAEIHKHSSDIELDPNQLNQIEERLSLLFG
ncbi:MAG: DNA repair protein RecN, partial [Pseudomonadota bacterium]